MAGGSKMSKRSRLYESESEEMSEQDNLEVFSLFVLLFVLVLSCFRWLCK